MTQQSYNEAAIVTGRRRVKGGYLYSLQMSRDARDVERCAACGLCHRRQDDSFELDLDEERDIPVGSVVTIEVTLPSLYMEILFVLLVPLSAAVSGGVVGYLIAGDESPLPLLFALAGFLSGVASAFFRARLKSKKSRKKAVKIVAIETKGD